MTGETLDLFASAKDRERRRTFEEFLEENPHFYREIVRMARKAMRAGKKIGFRCFLETLRYSIEVEQLGEFKVDNNIQGPMLDLIEEQEPDLVGYFRRKRRVA